jgi:hypothetical protein
MAYPSPTTTGEPCPASAGGWASGAPRPGVMPATSRLRFSPSIARASAAEISALTA